jgi:hypothetical protein
MKGWLFLIAKQQNRKVSSQLLSRTLKKAGIQAEAKTLELEDLQERLKEEYQHYYQIKGEAKQLRMTALDSLASALAEKGNSEKDKILKALRHREQQRSTAKKIKYLRGKIRTGSTTIVTTTNANGNKNDITNKTEMEQAILNSNKEKFSQSAHTPFYLSPLKDEFGFKGLTAAAQATLTGLYEPNHDINGRILEVIVLLHHESWCFRPRHCFTGLHSYQAQPSIRLCSQKMETLS